MQTPVQASTVEIPAPSAEASRPHADAVEAAPQRTLDQALFRGIAWTAVGKWLAQAFSWAMTLYAARVLSPSHFGLAAMAMMPIGLARLVENLGLDAVIVQDRSLDRDHIAELNGLAIMVAVGLICLFAALAVPISGFFHEPVVALMIVVLALTLLTDALQIVPRALLQKDLAFGRLAFVNALNVVVTATTLATCATLGFQQWSLVLNTLTGGVVVATVLLVMRGHPIRWPGNLSRHKRSITSGGQLLLSRAAWYACSNLDQTIIGRMLGKSSLGAYSFAMTFASLPVEEVTGLLSKVVPGVFSTVQNDRPQLRRYYLLLTELLSYLTLPMAVGIALVADDFILLALGSQWEAAILPLRILCIYTAINSAQSLLSHVLLWTGRFRINMLLNLLSLIVLPPAFYAGAHWGAEGVAWMLVAVFPLVQIPAFVIVGRILAMSFVDWLAVFRRAFVGCALMAAAVLLCRSFMSADWSHAVRLGLQVAVGAAAYVVAMLLLFGSRVRSIVAIVRGGGSAAHV